MAEDAQGRPQSNFVFLAAPLNAPRSEARATADFLLEVVGQVVHDHGLSVVRADQIAAPGNVTSQIIKSLLQARFVIADVSGSNPNVMYEVGVAHAQGQQVILLSQVGDALPFDIAVTRVIYYEVSQPGAAILSEELHRTVELLLSAGGEESTGVSPVQVALDTAREAGLQHAAEDGGEASPVERILATLGDMRERIASIESRMIGMEGRRSSSQEGESLPTYSRKIFIVHGHDDGLKYELRGFLKDLGFEPIILHERPDGGKTIYSKLLGEASDIGYAFVLLTPDDAGGEAASGALMPRARQNVVFEHGLFTGHLSPDRVCAIVRGSVEIPSDLNGVVYKHIPDGAPLASIAFDLARELRAAGYVVDMNKLD